jgi:hypothetical protein
MNAMIAAGRGNVSKKNNRCIEFTYDIIFYQVRIGANYILPIHNPSIIPIQSNGKGDPRLSTV